MDTNERWDHLNALDDELLKGGVMLSEWCTFIVRETDTAFVGGAHLACILTAVAGIETYLRSEIPDGARRTFSELIDAVVLDPELRLDLHDLRRYRNKWVHVNDPWEDAALLEAPEKMEEELERMAFFAARQLRRTIYANPWI
jgi:hypothetical protein